MQHELLKDKVKLAVAREWQEFAQRHPKLAAVIDQEMLVEQAVVELGQSAEYRQAMDRAATAGTAMATLDAFLRGWLVQWLRRLVGL